MIFKQDIQRLLHRPGNGKAILSVFLDTSVNSDNKRTYPVFLNQRKAQYIELASDREAHHREELGAAFERVERWLAEEYDEANKGVAIFTEIGGDWIEGLQFPVAVRNRTEVSDQPVIGPLAQVVEGNHHHGILLIDRESLRMLLVFLGEVVAEHEVHAEPYEAAHDVKPGGEQAKDYQKRKAEEVRHFFKEFALEVAEFDRRYRPDDLIVLGIDDNVHRFLDLLPPALRKKVVHTSNPPAFRINAEILEKLAPFFLEQHEKEASAAVDVLHDRARHRHLAIAGFHDTLEQLQEGKVDTLVLARDLARSGAHCLRCRFYLARHDSACPYCGGDLRSGVDLVEAMIRIAEEQEVAIEFVEPEALTDLNGAGALLKF